MANSPQDMKFSAQPERVEEADKVLDSVLDRLRAIRYCVDSLMRRIRIEEESDNR